MKEFLRGLSASSWALVVLLFLVLIALGWCSYDAGRDRRQEAARISANAAAVDRNVGAVGQAADERVTDTLNTATTKQELSDAVSKLPDAVPSARRVALACGRLRRQGVRDADLPAVCRSEGGAQARAEP